METLIPPLEWTPEVQAWSFKRGAKRQPWLVVDRLDHPALGLRYEQLTGAFTELGLRDDWDQQQAAEIALGVQAFISRELGEMKAGRVAWSPKMRTLAAVMFTERPGLPVPYRDFAVRYHEFRDGAAWGWGTGEAGFRRLYEHGIEQPYIHVDGGLGTQPWRLTSEDDYASLDSAWSFALTSGAGGLTAGAGFVPLLPVAVCSSFAVARRRVA